MGWDSKEAGEARRTISRSGRLIATGVILVGYEDQAGSCRGGWLFGGAAASLQDPDHRSVSPDDTNSNRCDYRNTENKRHEERNHDTTTLSRYG